MTGTAEQIVIFLMGQQDKDKQWDLTEHEEKRSNNQNSYYWTLAHKIAAKTHISVFEIHNRNLRDLGLLDRREDGTAVIELVPDTDECERETLLDPDKHLLPTHKTMLGNDGRVFRFYLQLRGSKTFNVEEFSALTDLIIQEAQAQGIETLTPTELAHMRELERQAEQRGAKK